MLATMLPKDEATLIAVHNAVGAEFINRLIVSLKGTAVGKFPLVIQALPDWQPKGATMQLLITCMRNTVLQLLIPVCMKVESQTPADREISESSASLGLTVMETLSCVPNIAASQEFIKNTPLLLRVSTHQLSYICRLCEHTLSHIYNCAQVSQGIVGMDGKTCIDFMSSKLQVVRQGGVATTRQARGTESTDAGVQMHAVENAILCLTHMAEASEEARQVAVQSGAFEAIVTVLQVRSLKHCFLLPHILSQIRHCACSNPCLHYAIFGRSGPYAPRCQNMTLSVCSNCVLLIHHDG